MTKGQYPAWQRRHEAVLLWMVQHPGGKLYNCAEATGYSRWQVSRIVNSPDFQQRYKVVLDLQLKQTVAHMFRETDI